MERVINMVWANYTMFNGTGLVELMQYNNTVTNQFFGVGILLALFFILYVPMSAKRPDIGLPMALFIVDIVAFLMVPLQLVGIEAAVLIMLAFAASFILMYRGGQHGI